MIVIMIIIIIIVIIIITIIIITIKINEVRKLEKKLAVAIYDYQKAHDG